MYDKERTYLKWKYLYYNGQTIVSDSVFDNLEDELKELGSELPFIVGSPNIQTLIKYNLLSELSSGEREIRFIHEFAMLSLRKFTVTMDKSDKELFPIDIVSFFNKSKLIVNCTPKFDGNSMELIYLKGILNQSLTRGNESGGLDRTEHLKIVVPNVLPDMYKSYDKIIIRGEVIIPTEIWEDKYSNSEKVDNPRNWLAGILNSDDVDVDIMNDIDFVAYNIVMANDGIITKPVDQLKVISNMGFDEIFNIDTTDYKDFFINVYPKFKEHRITSKYLLDGIVLTFPSNCWDELGANNHHPFWSCAVKFPPNRAITYLEDIDWKIGKDGEYTPIALFKAIELDGTIVKHASLHNLGWVIENKVFPGCKVEIAKRGEIIPQIINVLEISPDDEKYQDYLKKIFEQLQ